MHEAGIDIVKWSCNHEVLTNSKIKEFINTNQQYFAVDKVAKFLKKI
jgi:hypothetical protein